jgi:hypothetical protein
LTIKNMYFAVFLISCATLLTQVSLTRLFSVAIWHHFAFLVVAIAFLGFSVGGTILMLKPSYISAVRRNLSDYALFFSASVVLSMLVNRLIPFDPIRFSWDHGQIWLLFACYLTWAVPFCFSGLILSALYTYQARKVHTLYFSDLFGAAGGCMLAWVLFPMVGGEGALMSASLSAVLASWCFNFPRRMVVKAVFSLILLILMTIKPEPFSTRISPFKPLMTALSYPNAKILHTQWDVASRVDIVQSGAVRFAPGLSLTFDKDLPDQVGITVDGENLTAVTRFTGGIQDLQFVAYLPSSLPYALERPEKTLIMQAGGGLLGIAALYHGVKEIVCLEPNALVVDMMRRHLRSFSGDITERRPFIWIAEEGRTFLARNKGPYDLIQMGITDALGASSIGLYGLRESYDLTVEALGQVLSALSERGFFCATRYLIPPPRAEARLFNTALAALVHVGAADPSRHLAAIRSWGAFTLLMKKSPLTSEDLERIRGFCRRMEFDVVYYPGISPAETNRYNRLENPHYFQLLKQLAGPNTRDRVIGAYPFDLSAPWDDRPFFFHLFKIGRTGEIFQALRGKWEFFLEGGFLVYLTTAQSVLIALCIICTPLFFLLRNGLTMPKASLVYFFFLGIGYMLLEIMLMERFILFLGKPVYAFTATLSSLLASTGLGSLCGSKLKGKIDKRNYLWIALLIVVILIYTCILHSFITAFMEFSFPLRVLLALLIISPLGFLMGLPFPFGIAVLEKTAPSFIPWAWSINACSASVGASLSMVLALHGGFTLVTVLAAGCYLSALILYRRAAPKDSSAVQ